MVLKSLKAMEPKSTKKKDLKKVPIHQKCPWYNQKHIGILTSLQVMMPKEHDASQ